MDAEFFGLTAAAATALVQAMTTDAWGRVRDATASVWRRRGGPDGARVGDELAEAQHRLVSTGEPEAVRLALIAHWRNRILALVAGDPAAMRELDELLGAGTTVAGVRFGAVTHMGAGDVYQAGGNMTVTPRPAASSGS